MDMTISNGSCNRGEIKVSGLGEILIQPDCCTLEMTLQSKKCSMEQARASAKRRADYARQEIRNMHFQDSDITERTEDCTKHETCIALWTFELVRVDLVRAKALVEHLKSKLAGYMTFSFSGFLISEERLNKFRKTAITQAVTDAKHKAETIALAFSQRIRGLISVVESETAMQPLHPPCTDCIPLLECDKLTDWTATIRASERRICVRLDAICALGDFGQ